MNTDSASTAFMIRWASSLFPVLLLLPACKEPAPPATPPPPVVQIMEAKLSNVPRSVSFVGQLDSPQNVEVRARVESFLENILFEEGSEVKAGDLLAELDKKPYEEKLAAAKGMLAEAKAALAKSNVDVARLTPLVASGASPQRDLDTALANRDANTAGVSSAEARVKSAELDLGYCEIRAPLAGRIGAREVPVGSLVGKGEPTLLATISQVDPIWFYTSLSEVDYLMAERTAKAAGRKVGELPVHLILADGSEHPHVGKWGFVDRIVDPTTATIRVRAEFPNPDKTLRPGMFARVRVSLPTKEGNILVPERALVEMQGKYFLWVLDAANKAGQRLVEVAPTRIGPNAVLLGGVEEGERIVVEGVQKLREGVEVKAEPFQPVKAQEAAQATKGEPKPGKE